MNFRSVSAAACLVALAFAVAAGEEARSTATLAPPLEATLLDGSHYSLARSRGHVVLVNYWASWCGPCQQELPVFARYYRSHHAEGFDVLAIDVDDRDTRATALAIAKTLPFPVALVASVRTDAYARGCQPHGGWQSMVTPCLLPHSYLIGRDGRFDVDRRAGFDENGFSAAVGPLLKAPAQ